MNESLPFEVPQTPLGKDRSSFRSMSVTFPEPGLARVRPSTGAWVFVAMMILMGVGSAVFGVFMQWEAGGADDAPDAIDHTGDG